MTRKDYTDAIENGEVDFVNGNFRDDKDLTDIEKKDIERKLMASLTYRLRKEIDKGNILPRRHEDRRLFASGN